MSALSAENLTIRKFAELSDCDEKQVRRAIKAGKLKLDADGKLSPQLLGTGWRRPIRSSKAAADTSNVSAPSVRTRQDVKTDIVADGDTPAQAAAKLVVALGAEHELGEAIRIKENFNALLKQLEYEQKSGALVELALAQQVLFEEFRAQRDAWLNWPTRVGPEVAADLGLEADKVVEILTAHVHQHISKLGEPDPSFVSGEG